MVPIVWYHPGLKKGRDIIESSVNLIQVFLITAELVGVDEPKSPLGLAPPFLVHRVDALRQFMSLSLRRMSASALQFRAQKLNEIRRWRSGIVKS